MSATAEDSIGRELVHARSAYESAEADVAAAEADVAAAKRLLRDAVAKATICRAVLEAVTRMATACSCHEQPSAPRSEVDTIVTYLRASHRFHSARQIRAATGIQISVWSKLTGVLSMHPEVVRRGKRWSHVLAMGGGDAKAMTGAS